MAGARRDHAVEARRDAKAVSASRIAGSNSLRPGQPAVRLMGHREHAGNCRGRRRSCRRPRPRGRAAACLGIQEQRRRRRRRRGLAAVVARDLAATRRRDRRGSRRRRCPRIAARPPSARSWSRWPRRPRCRRRAVSPARLRRRAGRRPRPRRRRSCTPAGAVPTAWVVQAASSSRGSARRIGFRDAKEATERVKLAKLTGAIRFGPSRSKFTKGMPAAREIRCSKGGAWLADVRAGVRARYHPQPIRGDRRCRKGLFRAARLGDSAKAVALQQRFEVARDPAGEAGAFVDQGRVELDEARPGADAVVRVGAGFSIPPAAISGSLPPVAVRKSRRRWSASALSGAPESPPAFGCDGSTAAAGGEIVVLETISASIFRAIATATMSSISAGSRSGATLRKIGAAGAARLAHGREQLVERASGPAARAGPACWARRC